MSILGMDIFSQMVVCGLRDGHVHIWRMDSTRVTDLVCHVGRIRALQFLPDDILISCSADRTIIVWSIHDRQVIRHLRGHHTDDVRCLHLHVPTRMFVSGSNDMTVRLWSVDGDNCLRTYDARNDRREKIRSVQLDDMRVYAAVFHRVLIWSAVDDTLLDLIMCGHNENDFIHAIVLRNELLFTVQPRNLINMWNVGTCNLIRTYGRSACVGIDRHKSGSSSGATRAQRWYCGANRPNTAFSRGV